METCSRRDKEAKEGTRVEWETVIADGRRREESSGIKPEGKVEQWELNMRGGQRGNEELMMGENRVKGGKRGLCVCDVSP